MVEKYLLFLQKIFFLFQKPLDKLAEIWYNKRLEFGRRAHVREARNFNYTTPLHFCQEESCTNFKKIFIP